MPAPEVRAGDALSNPAEAAIITQIVRALEVGKVPLHDVGIISPYRAQVSSCVACCYSYRTIRPALLIEA